MDMVCWRLYWGFGCSIACVRHGEFETCCIAADVNATRIR
jgi:hypothetical protein